MSAGTATEDHAALHAWLKSGAGDGRRAAKVHETPIASVFVFADRVLKLKKPVDFGFLDFTTCAQREWAIRRELAFNAAGAPDVYRAVHAVRRTPEGAFTLGGGAGEIVDHVLEMRPFADDAILSAHPGRIDGALAERLGRDLARIQARAPAGDGGRGAAALDYVLGSNAEQLDRHAEALGRDAVARLEADSRAAFAPLRSLLDARGDRGFVRRCHGDLHLGNIVVEGGRPIFFDCIEFSDVLAEIDVGYDLAFLLMDLGFQGRKDAANRVLCAWADGAGRGAGADRLDMLAALPLFQSVRAGVRTHVCAAQGDLDLARRYLATAQRSLKKAPATLTAIGGLSGSGKSTLARRLAPGIGAAPGALVLRSDEIRKRLHGVEPTERLDKAAYAEEASARVYGTMLEEARAALSAGWPVVLDAAFLKLEERAATERLAVDLAVPFEGLWAEAPEAMRRTRVRARVGDASDADEAVVEAQIALDLGPIAWRRLDAGGAVVT